MANESTQRKSRRWLLAIDGSLDANRAAEYVARWAQSLGVAEVYVLNVQTLGSYRAYALDRTKTLLDAAARGEAATAVARRILDRASVPYRFHTDVWEVAETIVGTTHAETADEVVLGTRGMGAVASLVLGSVAYKVIHLADVPVTVVSNPRHEPRAADAGSTRVHRVLVAVDGSDHAARAVDYVCQLRAADVPVEAHLVNVQLPIASGGRAFVPHEVIDARYREEGEAALRAAREALTQAGIRFESHVMAGHLAATIVGVATDRRCTRIVMGTRGLGAVANVILGSVAYKVVHVAPVPVTLVK